MPNLEVFIGKIDRSDLSVEGKSLMRLFVDFFKESVNEKEEEIAKLKSQVSILEGRLQKVEDKADETNQYSRLDTLIISPRMGANGQFDANTVPIIDKAENTKNIVRQLLKQHLKLDIADSDISIAHRLAPPLKGKNHNPREDRRNIIFRLCRKDLVGTIFQHCKNLSPPFYINESLTPLRSKICYSLRQLKKKYPIIQKVRTFKGVPRVFLGSKASVRNTRRNNPGNEDQPQKIDIPTVLHLEEFTRMHLKTTLQEEAISFKDRV